MRSTPHIKLTLVPRILCQGLGFLTLCSAFLSGGSALAQEFEELGNQALASIGLVDVTAAPFEADPTGVQDSTSAINDAIVWSRDHGMVTYFPVGDYLVSDTIELPGPVEGTGNNTNDLFCVVLGETHVAGKRARIVLQDNAAGFQDPEAPGLVVHIYYPTRTGYNYTGHFNQSWVGVDIDVGDGNPGAVGMRFQSAEGSTLQDVTIDATDGYKGIWGIPASGGSTHKLTILGGRIGIDLREWAETSSSDDFENGVGVQPGPMISQLRLLDQTELALASRVRGSLTIVGAEIRSTAAINLIQLQAHWQQQPWDSSLCLIDTVLDMGTDRNRATIIRMQSTAGFSGRGYTFHNVFVRGADQVDSSARVPANGNDWAHFEELAVSVDPPSFNGNEPEENIIVDGAIFDERYIQTRGANEAPTEDLISLHAWEGVFPSATMPGIANIVDYGADPTGEADSSAAIQAAINDSRDVLVPKGTFVLDNPIELARDTRLVGLHHHVSRLRARDDARERRFGGLSPDADPIPMVSTVDDALATTTVGFVEIAAPRVARQHSRTPVVVYGLNWRAGRKSVLNNVRLSPYNPTNWRLELVMERDFELGQITNGEVVAGLAYSSLDVESRIFTENLGGNVRLMMPSAPEGVELTIMREDGGAFDLTSLDLSNATYEPDAAFTVTMTAERVSGGNLTATFTFPAGAQRDDLYSQSLNWTGVIRVRISSDEPFGVDNVVSSVGTADFDSYTETNIKVHCNDHRNGIKHYPFDAIRHPLVLFSGNGGGRWYNNHHHGDLWLRDSMHFLRIEDTIEPLRIYHWHLQHVHSTSQAVFQNARNVDVYGIKSEHNTRFLEVYGGDNIRIFGKGGLSDAEEGSSHFYFEEVSNFLVAGLGEEAHWHNGVQRRSHCDNPLLLRNVRDFDGIQEITGGEFYSTPVLTRPILYRRGNPVPPRDPALNFSAWLDEQGYEGANAAPLADPDGDGIPNLIAYAYFNRDGGRLTSEFLRVVSRDGEERIEVRRPQNRNDMQIVLESATSLAGPWTILGPQPVYPNAEVEWQDGALEVTPTNDSEQYFRLRVQQSPQ